MQWVLDKHNALRAGIFDEGRLPMSEEWTELVQALEQFGSVQVGNSIYTLGGRDGRLRSELATEGK